MDNYEERLKKCIKEINALQNEVVAENIEKNAKDIVEAIDSAISEIDNMFAKNKADDKTREKCASILEDKKKVIAERVEDIKSQKLDKNHWYVWLNDDFIKRQVEFQKSHIETCEKNVRKNRSKEWWVFSIEAILAIGIFMWVTFYLFSILDFSSSNIFMYEFGYYFAITLLVIFQALIAFFFYKFLPKHFDRIHRLNTLLTMIKTDTMLSHTNIQRELELIMKS